MVTRRVLRPNRDEEQEVTFLELFFDLVHVFAITQLSHRLAGDVTWAGAGRVLFLLLVAAVETARRATSPPTGQDGAMNPEPLP